ncbi:peptidase M1 (plasmid) [Azospirillum argentinense]|uniref:Peptidase M1 n=1 Tax=Azospirillum argentinense TaxID=2970906 RepID=A0A060DPI5_9PROT|nr:M1 family aminopeptidase [Azospirillum argentinense]AIB14737.1 peptidase M1 [Azospirillum argentinense]EZQ05096.1 peptidase M1, membrane alanine aminopeptidase [Azospirillum argentinense]
MRTLLLALLGILVAAPGWTAGLHHDLTVTLDPSARRLEVEDRLRLPAGTHRLLLAPGLAIDEARLDGKPVAVRGNALPVTVPEGGGELRLRYAGTLPSLTPESRGGGGGAEGAYLPGGTGWIPTPEGGPASPPSWRLSVRVPAPFVAVATGRLVEEARDGAGYTATFAEERSVEEPSLFAGPWQVTERMHNGLRLRTYFHPEQAPLADEYLDLSVRTIDAQAARIGAYPFAGFAILSAPLPVGLGFPGLTYIGRQVMPLPFIRAQSLPHEILHNWWGNGVRVGGNGNWPGNWSEGLTTFMADYAAAEARGEDAAQAIRLDWLRDYAALPAERDSALTDFRAKVHDAAQIVGYGKAAMLFHMLRAEIGTDTFDTGIRRFWEEKHFQDAGWDDLRRAFEASSGRDLGPFFEQWLTRVGAPTLELVQAKGNGDGVALILRQGEPAYGLTVPVEVQTAAGTERHDVRLDGRETTVTIRTAAAPRALAVDPGFGLFRRLAPGEAPPTLRDVTLDHAATTVIAADGPAAEAARALAERLADGKPRIAADRADGHANPAAPLAVIGTTGEVDRLLARLGLPPMPDSLKGRGTARVWTARTPQGRPLLAVAADDAAALQALLRPLPHYGRQSWLVFEGARAVDRGVWPAGDSPLRVSFE